MYVDHGPAPSEPHGWLAAVIVFAVVAVMALMVARIDFTPRQAGDPPDLPVDTRPMVMFPHPR